MLRLLRVLCLITPAAPAAAMTWAPIVLQDTVTIVRDSTGADSARQSGPRRLPVTAEVVASAFPDAATRELFARARRTRIAQDSALTSYDARVRQRFSVWGSVGRFGPQRLVYRTESASRVRWRRGVGARVEVTGARVAVPIVGSDEVNREALESNVTAIEMSPIPYFPGSESLWIGGAARMTADERNLVNPLTDGAEAYYTYRMGDSVSFRLPDGQQLLLRELRVRPRWPRANLVVGSLWFDVSSGQLVRAAYRLAAPARATVSVSSDSATIRAKLATFLIGSIIGQGSAELSGIVVEYGLFQGRFWLPRSQTVEGHAEIMFARIPVRYDNAFTYNDVNGDVGIATIAADTTPADHPQMESPPAGLDSAARRQWRDSSRAVFDAAVKARADSVERGLEVGERAQCNAGDSIVVTRLRYRTRLPVELRAPCDLDALASSPDLPASIFDSGEEIFGDADRDQLVAEAIGMAAQAPFSLLALPPAQLLYGFGLTRYNRVEGFSTALGVEQPLGAGLTAGLLARLGAADQVGNGELSLSRSNMRRTMRLAGYKRLMSANDWGRPLSFGSSLSALFFGRDDGFYYRAAGAEVQAATERGPRVEWRVFRERQWAAEQETAFSLAGDFIPNIAAAGITLTGMSARHMGEIGADPRGFRLLTDLRVEGATGDSTYGRAALDVTLSRALFSSGAVALTVGGGSSVGELPIQRRWFLGGTHTVRGQSADTAQSGSAFWLGRLELARTATGVRTALFGDLGWVGERDRLSHVGRPMSGVGIGFSGFDGLVRFDIARGLYPRRQTRFDLYLGARF